MDVIVITMFITQRNSVCYQSTN